MNTFGLSLGSKLKCMELKCMELKKLLCVPHTCSCPSLNVLTRRSRCVSKKLGSSRSASSGSKLNITASSFIVLTAAFTHSLHSVRGLRSTRGRTVPKCGCLTVCLLYLLPYLPACFLAYLLALLCCACFACLLALLACCTCLLACLMVCFLACFAFLAVHASLACLLALLASLLACLLA